MAITANGSAKSPTTENAANAGPTATVTPPGGMQSGDYVVVMAAYRGTGVTLAVGTTGGQTWTSETAQTQGTVITSRMFRCAFNGTWSADPTFTVTSGTNGIIAYMSVWRGVHATPIDTALAQTGYAAPTTPFDVARAGLTTTAKGAAVLYWWLSSDNNTWAMQTAGLDQYEAMWRQTTTTGLAVSLGWLIQPTASLASGSFTNRQSALGGDAGTTHVIALAPATITAMTEEKKRIGIGIWRPVPTAQTRRR